MNMTSKTTLLDALLLGCTITLPNDITLKGDPSSGYIEIGYIGLDGQWISEGLWNLSEEGLHNALADAEKMT